MAVIVRTAGAKRTKQKLHEITIIYQSCGMIFELTLLSLAPCLINEEGNLIKRSIRDLYTNEIEEILIRRRSLSYCTSSNENVDSQSSEKSKKI